MKLLPKVMLFVIALFAVACGSSSTDEGPAEFDWNLPQDTGPDATDAATKDLNGPEADDVVLLPGGTLEFVDQFGDDQKTCIQTDICTFNVPYNSERSLKVLYVKDGQPVENAAIVYEIIEDPEAVGKMTVGTVYTGTDGVSTGTVKVVKQIETLFKVKVTVYGEDADPIFFKINSGVKIASYLTVSFVYNGSQIFDGVLVYLFKSGTPTEPDQWFCEDFDRLDLPTADLQKGPLQLSQTAKFPMIPGLEDEGEQFYTICARGELVDGTPITYGCDDEHGHVMLTSSRHLSITLTDIPPTIKGSYDVQTELDLISALPDNVQTVINFLLNFFEKPSASILLLVCDLGGGTMEDFCGWVFTDEQNPDIYNLTTMGNIILEIIDSVLSAYVEEWTGYDIFGIGEDIRDMLKELRLLATFEMSAEPDEYGFLEEQYNHASWHTVSFKWTYGQNCPPNDDNCGVINFNIQAIGQDVIISQFPATLMFMGDYSELTIGEHSVLIKYGQLVNYILQKYVLPSVFGDGSDGLPVIDSYDKLMLSLLGGGKECLNPSPQQLGCCATFAENVFGATGGVGLTVLDQACEALVQLGSAYLEQTLVQLDTTSGDTLILSTKDGQPCKLYDSNADMKIDSWGKKEPKSERCAWDMELKVFNYYNDIDNNNFFGYLTQ